MSLVVNHQPLPNMLSNLLEFQVEPQEVKAVCNRSNSASMIYLIYQPFPGFHLEDKVKLLGGVLLVNLLLQKPMLDAGQSPVYF